MLRLWSSLMKLKSCKPESDRLYHALQQKVAVYKAKIDRFNAVAKQDGDGGINDSFNT